MLSIANSRCYSAAMPVAKHKPAPHTTEVTPATTQPTAPTPTPTSPVSSSGGDYAVLFIALFLAALLIAWRVSVYRAWKNRPQRLCTNCYVTAQPLQHKNKRWYCGHCGADNPAPLDSPLAQAYFAKTGAHKAPQLEG